MKAKLEKYKSKLVQEPAIIAPYLNPQIPKPTDLAKLKLVVDLVHNSLQCRYSAKVSSRQSIEQEAAGNSLFAAMFQPQRGVGGNGNEELEEEEDWDEEILDDGVIQMFHNQFTNLVFEASLDL
ncbi:unnamed protein product [Sphagnum jensenii]